MVRLASYNVHKCLGLDRRRRPERIMSVIGGLEADLVALQEVDHRLPPRSAALPPDLIARRSTYRCLPDNGDGPALGWHGQTILFGPRLRATGMRLLELPGLEPRGALLAEFATEAGPLRIVGVHLGLIRRYRQMQLAAIAAAIGRRPPMPTAILGDFNDWSGHGGGAALGADFRLHAPGPSFPAARPLGSLDRFALGPGLHLKAAGVGAGRLARVASDHLPVWADVTFVPDD